MVYEDKDLKIMMEPEQLKNAITVTYHSRKKHKMTTILNTVLVVVLILSLFIGTAVFLFMKSRKKPVTFDTKIPFIADIIKKTVATGSVVPRKEITIKPQISGIIEKIFVEPGDMVKKDHLIARIKIIPDMISLNNAESRLKKAGIQLDDAKKAFNRQKKLYNRNIITESKFLEYELKLNTAREEFESAKNNLQLIRDGISKKFDQTTNTLIRSTIGGMILEVPVKEGVSVIESNNFNEGTTIAIVADMTEMIFKGKVDESEVGKIKPGMDLILTIGAIENETFNAKLEYIAPKGIDEQGTIQFEIRAKLDLKKSHFLRAGYSANADIVLDRRDRVMTIHESLLQFEDKKAYVEVMIGPDQYEKRFIETGLSDGINIQVTSGLTLQDRIKVWNRLVR